MGIITWVTTSNFCAYNSFQKPQQNRREEEDLWNAVDGGLKYLLLLLLNKKDRVP